MSATPSSPPVLPILALIAFVGGLAFLFGTALQGCAPGDAPTPAAAPPAAPTAAAPPPPPVAPFADAAALSAALALIPTDPPAAATALDAIPGFEPAVWGAWLLLATRPGDPAAEADAVRRWERAREAGVPPGPWPEFPAALTRADALLFARFAAEDRPEPIEIPCGIAERWPADWAEAFGPWHGSSRDIGTPGCPPPLDAAWAAVAVAAAFDAQIGPETSDTCGSIAHAHRAHGRETLFRAWHLPRTLLDPAVGARLAAAHADLRAELATVTGPDSVDAILGLSAAPPRDWSNALRARARRLGLSAADAAALERVVAQDIVDFSVHAELACSRPGDLRNHP